MGYGTFIAENKRSNIQPKLTIGQPNDKYEQEADRMADQVMRMPQSDAPIQRQCENCGEEELQMKPLAASITPIIQKQAVEEEEEMLQMQPMEEEEEMLQPKSESGNINASNSLSSQLSQSKGNGSKLSDGTNQKMSNAFGTDFSNVNIHTDSNAIQMNQSLGARAFTHGSNVYFNEGEYNPESGSGKHLLAHELTHVVQQGGQKERIQRLAVSQVSPLATGNCGRYSVSWKFELGAAAPSDGYMVQQIDFYRHLEDCPMTGQCPASPQETFWEAWKFNSGDTLFSQYAGVGYSDMSSYGGNAGKSGYVRANGTIKFFPKSKTGDLGDLNTAPPAPIGGWGPGNNAQSGSLPSTNTKPTWWDDAPTEGPTSRFAMADWRCCNDSDDFNNITATP